MRLIVRRGRYFTLLEMMVVLVIIGIIGSVVGLNLNRAVRAERFNAGVALLVDKIQLAQDIMINVDLGTYLVIDMSADGTIYSTIIFDSSSVPKKLSAVGNKRIKIPGVKNIALSSGEFIPLTLKFISGGGKMSKGDLIISSYGGDIRYINLPGCPHAVSSQNQPTEEIEEDHTYELYPQEIL